MDEPDRDECSTPMSTRRVVGDNAETPPVAICPAAAGIFNTVRAGSSRLTSKLDAHCFTSATLLAFTGSVPPAGRWPNELWKATVTG